MGVMEIRINSYLAREITWQHNTREPWRQHELPPFVMTIKESGWVLPHPSVIFHAKNSPGSPWVAWTLSLLLSIKWGKVSSYSTTVEATLLAGFHIAHMCQYTTQACSPGPDDRSSIDTGGGYHLGALNLTSDHSQHSHPVFSTFP
jgi:hypothetical protein